MLLRVSIQVAIEVDVPRKTENGDHRLLIRSLTGVHRAKPSGPHFEENFILRPYRLEHVHEDDSVSSSLGVMKGAFHI
ncbi:hypothetical protein D3C81_1727080 [compost metagenome]